MTTGPIVSQGSLIQATADILNQQMTAGASGAQFGGEGNLFNQVYASKSPALTGADKIIAIYSLPASLFDVAGRAVLLNASGSFANNGDTKQVKIIINPTAPALGATVSGGTTIADTGASTTSGGVGWALESQVAKYGAAGSNTQVYQELATIVATTHGGVGVPGTLTLVESGTIPVVVTANATTTATDIVLNFFSGNMQN